jgi:adenylate kinase
MIILFGVVGSGKSEQARRLVAKIKCPYISTSDLLRENLTPQVEETMLAGRLISDDYILSLLDPALKSAGADTQECILDGAPRTIIQADWLIDKVKSKEVKLTSIIHLRVTKKVVLERLRQRSRQDDKEEVIAQRLKDYEQITTPVLDYLRQAGFTVNEIDGKRTPEQIENDIAKLLKLKP